MIKTEVRILIPSEEKMQIIGKQISALSFL